jgi:hypothetical protein
VWRQADRQLGGGLQRCSAAIVGRNTQRRGPEGDHSARSHGPTRARLAAPARSGSPTSSCHMCPWPALRKKPSQRRRLVGGLMRTGWRGRAAAAEGLPGVGRAHPHKGRRAPSQKGARATHTGGLPRVAPGGLREGQGGEEGRAVSSAAYSLRGGRPPLSAPPPPWKNDGACRLPACTQASERVPRQAETAGPKGRGMERVVPSHLPTQEGGGGAADARAHPRRPARFFTRGASRRRSAAPAPAQRFPWHRQRRRRRRPGRSPRRRRRAPAPRARARGACRARCGGGRAPRG